MSPRSDQAGELLRARGLRSTPQRRAILAAFRGGTAEHLSAVPESELRSHPNFDDRLLREVARAIYLWEQERRETDKRAA